MTEQQFTPEYIAFMQSDEAKALQRLLPRKGEGVWFIERSQNMFTGEWDEWSDPHVLDEDSAGFVLDYEDYEDQEFVIVPTLWQLLRIIEGAGYEMEVGHVIGSRLRLWQAEGCKGGWSRNDYDPDKHVLGFRDKDLMLAAAKLAVKVVEGKG